MRCPGNCGGCAGCGEKLGAYTEAPPLAFPGWRLRVGGNPPGGQYHGFLGADHAERRLDPSPWDFFNPGHTAADGVYRSPGETPPSANPNRETNIVVVRHQRRRAGYSVVPGAFSNLGYIYDPCEDLTDQERAILSLPCPSLYYPAPAPVTPAPKPAPVAVAPAPVPIPVAPAPKPVSNIRYSPVFEHLPAIAPVVSASTQPVVQPPPTQVLQPAPVVDNAPPPPGMYRDAAGNLTSDWHNPYSLYLPETIQPAPTVAASTSLTPGAGQMATSVTGGSVQGNAVTALPSWLSDPSQELISGLPNWGLVAIAGAALLLMKGKR